MLGHDHGYLPRQYISCQEEHMFWTEVDADPSHTARSNQWRWNRIWSVAMIFLNIFSIIAS